MLTNKKTNELHALLDVLDVSAYYSLDRLCCLTSEEGLKAVRELVKIILENTKSKKVKKADPTVGGGVVAREKLLDWV